MRKLIAGVASASLVLVMMAPMAMANVIHSSGPTGQPVYHYSNQGSTQGQTNRSAQGTQMKTTHDAVPIWYTQG